MYICVLNTVGLDPGFTQQIYCFFQYFTVVVISSISYNKQTDLDRFSCGQSTYIMSHQSQSPVVGDWPENTCVIITCIKCCPQQGINECLLSLNVARNKRHCYKSGTTVLPISHLCIKVPIFVVDHSSESGTTVLFHENYIIFVMFVSRDMLTQLRMMQSFICYKSGTALFTVVRALFVSLMFVVSLPGTALSLH